MTLFWVNNKVKMSSGPFDKLNTSNRDSRWFTFLCTFTKWTLILKKESKYCDIIPYFFGFSSTIFQWIGHTHTYTHAHTPNSSSKPSTLKPFLPSLSNKTSRISHLSLQGSFNTFTISDFKPPALQNAFSATTRLHDKLINTSLQQHRPFRKISMMTRHRQCNVKEK